MKAKPFTGNHSNATRARPDENDESIEQAMLKVHLDTFDASRWQRGLRHKRAAFRSYTISRSMRVPAAARRSSKAARYISADNKSVKLKPSECREPRGSLGYANQFFSLLSKAKVMRGVLIVPVDPKTVAHLESSSLRLFRWHERDHIYQLIQQSDVQVFENQLLVWARITQPGDYAVIGLPSAVLVQTWIKAICGLQPVLAAADDAGRIEIRDTLCQLILCQDNVTSIPEWRDQSGDQALLRAQGYQSLCQHCTEILIPGIGRLPECDLIHTVQGDCSTKWESVGPVDYAGAFRHVLVDPGNPNALYAAGPNCGLWRLNSLSNYPETIWRALTDFNDSLMVRAFAVATSDPNRIYLVDNLWKMQRSDDRGLTWQETSSQSLGSGRRQRDIVVHPSDSQTVFIGTNTGLWGSFDGGGNWERLYDGGNVYSLAMDPTDSSIMYLAVEGIGVLKTYNMGRTFELMLPWSSASSPVSKIALVALGNRTSDGIPESDADRTVAAKFGSEIFVNRQGGRGSWVSKGKLGGKDNGNGYEDWCHLLAVDPFDHNIILAGAQNLSRSSDGGDSWFQFPYHYPYHEDMHQVCFHPSEVGRVFLANDGGVFQSFDSGQTWGYDNTSQTGFEKWKEEYETGRNLVFSLVSAEFYRVGIAGNHALGNLFHSGIKGSVDLNSADWFGVQGNSWEWNYVFGDPKRDDHFYVFHQDRLYYQVFVPAYEDRKLFRMSEWPPYVRGENTSKPIGAIAADPRPGHDLLLVGTNETNARLMLTRNPYEREPADASNPEGLRAVVWEEALCLTDAKIVAVGFAPGTQGAAVAITSNGDVYTTPDASVIGSWELRGNVGASAITKQLAINYLDGDRLYVVTEEGVYRSVDGGDSSQSVVGATLPPSELNSVVADPYDAAKVYVGADIGVYLSLDEGTTWEPFDDGLPNAEVLQVQVEGTWLYAVTHGRGLWRSRLC